MAFLFKKLSVKSLTGKLTSKLGKLGGSLKSFAGKLGDAASSIISKATSTLSGAFGVGGIKEGMKSLTSGLSGQGLVQLTSGAAGNLLTPITGGAGDIAKITGGAASSGFNFAFSGGSGASAIASMMGAAQSTLSSLTSSIIPGGLSAITGKISASLSKITGILPNNIISTITGSASGIISGAAGDIFKTLDKATNLGIGQPLKDIVEGATNRIAGPIDILVNNQKSLKKLDKFNLVGLIDGGKIVDAAKLIDSKVKSSKDLLSSLEVLGNVSVAGLTAAAKDALIAKWEKDHPNRQAFIEETLAEIDTTVTGAMTTDTALDALGDKTVATKKIGEGSEKWDGVLLQRGDYVFDTVTSFAELESEFRSADRDITEVIVNWTDTFKNSKIGKQLRPWDLYEEIASTVGEGHFHYLIMQDGSLVKMAPIGRETNHTSFGGWKSGKSVITIKNDSSHDKHSIGIAFAGGINAFPPGGRHDETNKLTFNDAANYGRDYQRNLHARKTGFGRKIQTIDYTTKRSNESYSLSQNKTFNKFMDTYYTVWPGGQAWGLNDLAPDHEAPGFSVLDYISTQFDKVNTQTPEEPALSSKELKAKMIANKIKELTNG